LETTFCQGLKFEVIGKIDGSDRTKTWRVYLGSIPTSTFNSNIRYEQSLIATRYGIIHVHIWLYYPNILIN
jgi:ribosomal protein S3